MTTSQPAKSPQKLLLFGFAPFPAAIAVTLIVFLIGGARVPRQIAPGSGLKLAGLVAALAVLLAVASHVRRRWNDPQVLRFFGLLGGLTSLMAWPVWTVGVLPSVNGMMVGSVQQSTMRIARLTTSHASKGREVYHWADLEAESGGALIASGRYFVPGTQYKQWQAARTQTIRVRHARGLLGAQVVIDFE